jgi:hypothetical protein
MRDNDWIGYADVRIVRPTSNGYDATQRCAPLLDGAR